MGSYIMLLLMVWVALFSGTANRKQKKEREMECFILGCWVLFKTLLSV
jgi:hypothetical protein